MVIAFHQLNFEVLRSFKFKSVGDNKTYYRIVIYIAFFRNTGQVRTVIVTNIRVQVELKKILVKVRILFKEFHTTSLLLAVFICNEHPLKYLYEG